MSEVKILRRHEFHSTEPVISVHPGTLKIRDSRWVEVFGTGSGSATIPESEAGAWKEVREILAADLRERGEPEYRLSDATPLFYLVEEEGKVSCGCISYYPDRKLYSLIG